MAKVQTIRRRIKSVKNIKQITKAMEMVAASKLRRAQEATLKSRTYATSAREALARLRALAKSGDHPLFKQPKSGTSLIILFSSDRGLAGAYNSNIFKALVERLRQTKRKAELIVVGQRGAQFATKLKDTTSVTSVYTNWPARPSITDVRPIATTVIERFAAGGVAEVAMLYTDFVSMIRQEVTTRVLLPINRAEIMGQGRQSINESLFEPSPREVFSFIVPRFIEMQIYQASLEAAASEQSMRMVAMKNATDNAGDIIGDLTLRYNGVRQAAITQELAEISAGAEAMV